MLRAGADRAAAWRSLAAVMAPALLLPAAVYGAFLTGISAGDLLFENLYPRDFIDAAGSVVLDSHAPLHGGERRQSSWAAAPCTPPAPRRSSASACSPAGAVPAPSPGSWPPARR